MAKNLERSESIKRGLDAARARGRVGGRVPADPEVGTYVVTGRKSGRSWATIAAGLNHQMDTSGAPRPPQGAPRWCRSSLQSIHGAATRASAG